MNGKTDGLREGAVVGSRDSEVRTRRPCPAGKKQVDSACFLGNGERDSDRKGKWIAGGWRGGDGLKGEVIVWEGLWSSAARPILGRHQDSSNRR